MGVHDVDKYPEVKALLGIPEDEPIFILRAQDEAAIPTINAYWDVATDLGVSEDFASGIDNVRSRFEDWRLENSDLMKVPD